MNKEQAMLKVADLEKELAQLKQIINQPEKSFKRWRAGKNENYYFVSEPNISFNIEEFDNIDNYKYSTGNYFQTKEEAEEYKEKIIFNQQVIDRIAELNEGWKPDWSIENQIKHRFVFDNSSNILCVDFNTFFKSVSDNKYFKSKEIGEQIIKEFDNEKLIKWFI